MVDSDDQIQATAEAFCRGLVNYDERRGSFAKFCFLCLHNAIGRARRAAVREAARQARQVPFDEEVSHG